MKNKEIKLHQGNMFCTMCLMNVATVLSQIKSVVDFGIDLKTKTIRIRLCDDNTSQKTIRTLINQALTTGGIPYTPDRQIG